MGLRSAPKRQAVVYIISRIFGATRVFTKAGRVGLCIDPSDKFASDPGVALIEKIYFGRSQMLPFLDLNWNDEVVSRIAQRQVAVSTGFLIEAAEAALQKVGGRNRYLSESFKSAPNDDKWLAETALFDLLHEKIKFYRLLLQSLERKSHDKRDIVGHFFRRARRTESN